MSLSIAKWRRRYEHAPEVLSKYHRLANEVAHLCPHAEMLFDRAMDGDYLAREMLEWLAGHAHTYGNVISEAWSHLRDRDKIAANNLAPPRLRFERIVTDAPTNRLRAALREAGVSIGDSPWPK